MALGAMVFGWFVGSRFGGWLWKMLGDRRFGGGEKKGKGRTNLSIQVSMGCKM